MRALFPISMFPRIVAPAPISTPRRTFRMTVHLISAGSS